MTLSALQQKLIFVWFRSIDRIHAVLLERDVVVKMRERNPSSPSSMHALLWGSKCSCEKVRLHREWVLLLPGHSHGHPAFGRLYGLYFPTPVMQKESRRFSTVSRFSCRINKDEKQRARVFSNEFKTLNSSDKHPMQAASAGSFSMNRVHVS